MNNCAPKDNFEEDYTPTTFLLHIQGADDDGNDDVAVTVTASVVMEDEVRLEIRN